MTQRSNPLTITLPCFLRSDVHIYKPIKTKVYVTPCCTISLSQPALPCSTILYPTLLPPYHLLLHHSPTSMFYLTIQLPYPLLLPHYLARLLKYVTLPFYDPIILSYPTTFYFSPLPIIQHNRTLLPYPTLLF